MRTLLAVLAAVVATAGGLTSCASDEPDAPATSSSSPSANASPTAPSPSAPSPSSASSSSPSPNSPSPSAAAGTTIQVVIKGDKATPNGDRVKVRLGQPVTLDIRADAPGEIHVHSTPEQEIEYPEGSSTKRLTITKPGIVDVEVHELDQVIVQLQVS
jgi:hypothetical protein